MGAGTNTDLDTARGELTYVDYSAEFPELEKSRYKAVVYLSFSSSIEVRRIMEDFALIEQSIPAPSVFIIDVINYQDMYSITSALDSILAAQSNLFRKKHHQFTLLNPANKVIVTLAEKVMHLTKSTMEFIFVEDGARALAEAKTKIHEFLATSAAQKSAADE
ncbi:hypothetical protein KC640_02760 [Candidatus Dojkabacteria bacterium]|uniref:Uncharacterized protein n=1 Tax=Candidatus Dojkabacteria bacterium TaxID=2099670 RepID=A0A955KZP7_9BACT|nr:hypothetical protein [Candidatus Dojkabacteria bacterium]